MSSENLEKETSELDEYMYDNPEENLLGVFTIFLDVAKRKNPEKYLIGYMKNND